MGDGRRQRLPCGHVGEAVIGHFYACTVPGCDGTRRCHRCGGEVEPFVAESVPDGSLACAKCGSVRWSY